MKTATVRDLRTKFPAIARELENGEEIGITRRGRLVARLLPPAKRTTRKRVDWTQSAAFKLPRKGKPMSAKQVAALLEDSKGTY
jgi:antitoxin (DNA-binding transcriptional repressor) of toxin-antitoxin stability system